MNIRLGLERISAVWWGFWAVLSILFGVGILMAGREHLQGLLFVAALLPLYALHRLTCWVIAGFFVARS